jgi:hypothetical protein
VELFQSILTERTSNMSESRYQGKLKYNNSQSPIPTRDAEIDQEATTPSM